MASVVEVVGWLVRELEAVLVLATGELLWVWFFELLLWLLLYLLLVGVSGVLSPGVLGCCLSMCVCVCVVLCGFRLSVTVST